MQTGPSKEELKNYWNTSREYFDELARHYRESDPEYYREYIAPFYSNPLYGAGGKSGQSGRSVRGILVSVIFFLVIGAGAAFFLIQSERESGTEPQTEKVNPLEESSRRPSRDVTEPAKDSSYAVGLRYFNEGDYDNAEKYLRRVKRSDENYSDARKKINEITKIKKKR